MSFLYAPKVEKICSTKNNFLKNNFSNNIFRQKIFYLKQQIRKEDSNFFNEKERRSTNDQRESSTTRDRNEWRYADVSAGFGFRYGCEFFFRTFFSSFILISYIWVLSFVLGCFLPLGTGEPTRDGHATFTILS
jgi:hypothetical protein